MTYSVRIPDTIDLTLERMIRALAALGNPHLCLPPVIHVAGTNGKGSTIAFLKTILEGEGKHVHCYTSPHLVRMTERIVLNGSPISTGLFDELTKHVKDIASDLSYFEVLTCVAFLAFSRVPADYILLEVGLGGRLDATNVVDPLLSVITSISLDHQEYLGDSIAAIAQEKAGIIKFGKPVVLAHQPYPEVYDLVYNCARLLNAPVIRVAPLSETIELGLFGKHQCDNAATALAVANILLGKGDYCSHLKKTRWPGRLQRLSTTPDVWVDGAHNADGIRVLTQELRHWKTLGKQLILCISQLSNRSQDILTPALDIADEIIHIDMQQGDRFHPKPSFVKKSFTPEQALLHFHEDAYNNTRILFMGSLYMVGEILKTWENSYGCNE